MSPVDTLKQDSVLIAHIANAVSRVVHSGIWSAWEVIQALVALKGVDLAAFKASVKDLVNEDDRKAVEEAFKNALLLQDEKVQAKVLQSVDVLEAGVSIAEQGILLYSQVVDLVVQTKNIINQ